MRYLISHDLGFILQSFHLLPIQYDLGVGCVPHYLYRRLTGSYKQTKMLIKVYGPKLQTAQHFS